MEKDNFIDVTICTRDRPTELALLLQSLRTQTHQLFDVFILDDGSRQPVGSHNYIQQLVMRLKLEGHRVDILRMEKSIGVARARQYVTDHVVTNGRGECVLRVDDDTVLEVDYLRLLLLALKEGYDIVSGTTPNLGNADAPRETRFVKPVINRVVLDGDGRFVVNGDDCGHTYIESEVIPTHHFRSAALMTKGVCEKVKYETWMTGHGFREEQFFSFRAILAGFKIGVHTGAEALHFRTPSGGERSYPDAGDQSKMNQIALNRWVKEKYKEVGDFIQDYNKKLGIGDEGKLDGLEKETNCIYSKEM